MPISSCDHVCEKDFEKLVFHEANPELFDWLFVGPRKLADDYKRQRIKQVCIVVFSCADCRDGTSAPLNPDIHTVSSDLSQTNSSSIDRGLDGMRSRVL